jgi:hypothetical protein
VEAKQQVKERSGYKVLVGIPDKERPLKDIHRDMANHRRYYHAAQSENYFSLHFINANNSVQNLMSFGNLSKTQILKYNGNFTRCFCECANFTIQFKGRAHECRTMKKVCESEWDEFLICTIHQIQSIIKVLKSGRG